jgi:hypothetical protein
MRLKEGGQILQEKRGHCILFSVVFTPSPKVSFLGWFDGLVVPVQRFFLPWPL